MIGTALTRQQRWERNLRQCTSTAVETPSVVGSLLIVAVIERAIDYSFPAPVWHCVTVGIVAWVTSFWIPLAASRVVGERPSRPVVMLIAFLASAVVFALITYWGLAPHAPVNHPEATLAGRLSVLVPSRVALWLGITYLADASHRMVSRRRALSDARSQLSDLMAAAEEQVSQVPDAAAREVRAALAVEVASIRASARPDLDARLYALIEDVVRPMSQRLASQVPRWKWGTVDHEPTDQRHLTRQLLAGIDLRSDLLPGLIATLFAVTSTLTAVVTLGVQGGVMAALGVGLSAYLAASLLRHLPQRWFRHRPLVALVMRAAAIGVLAGVLMDILALGHSHATTLAVQAGAVVFIITVALGLTSSGARVIASTDEQLRAANEQVVWRTARLHAQSWVTQHGLAMKLHGSVQSAMQACLLRLRTATPHSDVEPVLAELERSLDLLLAVPEAQPPVTDQLRNISDTWRGITDVTWWLSAADAAKIDADPVCATVVQSVLQDSVSNGVRHGGATHVAIDIEVMNDVACLTIVNDGEAISDVNAPGFGTAQLEACAVRWERDLSERPTRLHALLPLAAGPAKSA